MENRNPKQYAQKSRDEGEFLMVWISVEPTNPHHAYHTRECGAMQQIRPVHLRSIAESEAVRRGKKLCGQCQVMDEK